MSLAGPEHSGARLTAHDRAAPVADAPAPTRREGVVASTRAAARRVALTFHGIGTPARALEPGEGAYWVGESPFLRMLDVLRDVPEIEITFDDGNTSDLEIAARALEERGMRATFFIVAGRLGAPHFLDAGGVRTLGAMGMGLGVHGMTHVPWRRLNKAGLDREIAESKVVLESVTQRELTEAACPFGQYDRRALCALRAAGFRRVMTSDGGSAAPGAWLQPRTSIRAEDSEISLVRVIAAARRSSFGLALRRTLKQWR
jgi:peptidoglycan/xylan/chitin deacetylase (PgdA/CDA1 family)